MISNLTTTTKDKEVLLKSTEVAKILKKNHNNLSKTIRTQIEAIEKVPVLKADDFFIKKNYLNTMNHEYPYFLITKKGLELLIHKMIGENGVIASAIYMTDLDYKSCSEQLCEIDNNSKYIELLKTVARLEEAFDVEKLVKKVHIYD